MSNHIIYIGLDDTDTLESRGTGSLARQIAAELGAVHVVSGVTRHQLLLDERVPYTAKNSCASICLCLQDHASLSDIYGQVRALMLANLEPGSDPGLCLATESAAHRAREFGQRAKKELVTQTEARALAAREGISLEGLGGSQDGVIGALAAVGLAAWGEDGRYIQIGSSRQLYGLLPVQAVIESGIHAVQTPNDESIQQGMVLADKLRPARRKGFPVLYVEWEGDHWMPLKID